MKKRLFRSLLALGLVLFTVNLWSQSVLICGAPTDQNWNTDVQSKLLATGQFTTVNYFYMQNATPTLADLLAYDAVLHFTDWAINDPTTLGNNLAAYIDQGGAVVNCVFEYNWGTLAGNFNNYRIASGGSMNNTPVTLGSISTPTHPILSGVNTFFGGSSSYHMTGSTFSANSNIQAYYNDGSWMVATKENVGPMNARRVDLNFYPPSSDARSDFWDASTNGALLMANALTWAMGGSSAIAGCTNPSACNYDAAATTDNGSCTFAVDYFADADGDGYGTSVPTALCSPQAGYVTNNTDCDDANSAANPIASETYCNGVDENCNGSIDENAIYPQVTISYPPISCVGGTTEVTVVANGGVSPYVGTGVFTESAGTYTYNVTDANGCNGNVISTFNNLSDWTQVASAFATIETDDFNYLPDYTNLGPSYSHSTGGITWSATTQVGPTGLWSGYGDLSTNDATSDLVITFNVPLNGVGGNFYNSNFNGYFTPGVIEVFLSNGTVLTQPVSNITDWLGFYSNTSTIESIVVHSLIDNPTNYWPSVDNLQMAYGAPINQLSITIPDGITPTTDYYADADGDGFGTSVPTALCSLQAGYVTDNTDCDDTNNAVNTAATEVCNSIDDNCNSQIDEGLTFVDYYADGDGDGYGAGSAISACTQPTGYVSNNTDCNDNNAAINPAAVELCNGSDDDCDTQIDNGLGAPATDLTTDLWILSYDWYCSGAPSTTNINFDSNGNWNQTTSSVSEGLWNLCENNFTLNFFSYQTVYTGTYSNGIFSGTMDDMNGGTGCFTMYPANSGCTDATACNYNAAATTNDGSCVYGSTYYVDADGDGFGGQSGTVTTQDYGYGQYVNSTFTENHIDIVFPQTMNNLTSFTVSVTNDAGVSTNWFYFHDAAGNNVASIEFMPQDGGTINTTYTFPTPLNGITDVSVYSWWNGIYLNDVTFTTSIDASVVACTQPAGYVTNNTDCDDSNNAINPNAAEICGNGYDDDCDGTTDEVPGDANAWGQGEWLANVYNGVYFESYQGYYVRQGNSYNTESDFPWDGTPSNAAGYVGCAVPGDFHSVKYRRQGFPTSIYPYAITVPSWDDDVYVYVDGALVWSAGCCGNGMSNNIVWTGNLTETSTVEVSFGEYGGSSFLSFIVEPQYPLNITGSTAISNYACYDFNYYAQVTQSYGVDPSTMTYNVTSANGLIDVAAITPTFNGSEVIFNFSPNSIVGEDIITIAVADNMGLADTLVVNVNLTECPPPLQVFGNTEINVDACTDFNIFVGASSALGYDVNSLTYVTTFSDETYVQSTTPNYIDLWGNEAYIYFNASGQMGSTIATTVVTDPLGNSDTLVTLVNFGVCSPVMGSNYVDIISCGDSVVTLNFTYAFNVPGVSQSVGSISSSNTNAVPNENIVFVSSEPATLVNNGITYYGATYTYEVTFANLGQWTEINGYMQDDYNFNNNFWYSMESVIDDSAPQLSADFATIDITLPSGVCDTIISWDELVNPVNAFGTNSTYITNQHAGTFYAAINGGNGLTTLGVDGNSGADCDNGNVANGNFTISTADGSSFEVYYSNTLNTGDPSLYQLWFVPVTETAVTTNIDFVICDHTFILENLSGTPQSYFFYLFASQDGTTYDATVLQSVAQEVANNFSGYMSTPNGTFDLVGLSANMSSVVNSVNTTILNDGNYYAINNDYVSDDNGLDVGISDGGNDIYDDGNYLTTNFNDYYGNGEQGGGIPYTNGQVAVGGPSEGDAMFTLNISEACDYTVTSSIPNGSSVGVGTTVIDFVVTDNSGNITTYSVTINVVSEGVEVCNNLDDNCDSQIDEGLAFNNYYTDADGDGFGAGTAVESCSQPAGYVTTNTDCNDALAAVNPSVTENCSTSYDDNCNGVANEGCVTNLPGENPSNAISVATSVWPNCFSNVNSTLVGMSPSANAQTVCLTGEDKWYQFVATTEGVSILVNSTQNDILIELQTAAGTLVAQENAVAGIGTEILNHFGLTAGQVYKVGIRNYDSSLGIGTFSACVRMLKRGGCDSGVSPNWSNTLSLCQVFKATWPGSGSSVRFTFTGLTGTGAGNVYTKTQSGASADQLILATVTPTLPYGTLYNVLITNIYTLQDGAGNNEVMEVPALTPCTLNTIAEPVTQLRASDNCSSGPRFRSAVVASLPWVCGTVNWRWEFVEVDGSNNPVGLPIYHLRNAASNYLNLGTVSALQYGKTYRVRTCPILTYTGTNYNWGPAQYMCIIGQSGMAPEVQVNRNNDLVDNSANVNIYPNPTNGSDINIQLSNITSENVQVRVLDAMGRVVFANRYAVDGMFTTNMTFDRPLANGLYMIETSFNGEVITQRMMVQK